MTDHPHQPDLGLYVHVPWCVRKCPYCDFNSHGLKADQRLPEKEYLAAFEADLEIDLKRVPDRAVKSLFFGGGTPSLLSVETLDHLLEIVRQRLELAPDCEITLEANPGALDRDKAAGFRQAGVNRISIGGQSFSPAKLNSLGRIHSPDETRQAASTVASLGYASHNLDLMYALPSQTTTEALEDLQQALQLAPPHLSLYQLTLEPNTPFHHNPPQVPDDDETAEMEQVLLAALTQAGYRRYEVSAFARPGHRCQHNLNYWQFGDYLGIGPGAHGKLTTANGVVRTVKQRQPSRWLNGHGGAGFLSSEQTPGSSDLIFEFMLNALRLIDGVPLALFQQNTGLPLDALQPRVNRAIDDGLLIDHAQRLQASPLGLRFLNDLTARFLPVAA
ncbi:MAG: radical SAM family heme chaperone HemW [Gammaproteobacteria bacterium]|nr:radical SAM family heme chaperone HemW [Gammaproteobacteria bacterium]